MAHITVSAQKSSIRPKRLEGGLGDIDLRLGEWIIFEHKNVLYLGQYQGWKLVSEVPHVKTDLHDPAWLRVDVPLDKVWRVYDARDEEIERLRASMPPRYRCTVCGTEDYGGNACGEGCGLGNTMELIED